MTEAGDVVTIVPPTSMTICPFWNPLPRICTVDPATPEVGARIIVGAVIAKVAVAVLPDASVTTTVLLAVAVNGTVNDVATVPPVPVVPAAAVIATPLTVTVDAVHAVAKPVPAMVTVDPLTIPVVGVSVIEDVTVNNVVVLLVPSLSSKVYCPAGIDGTMNQVVTL